MGLIRKAISMSTFGAVDFRSDKERIARYTRQSRDAHEATLRQVQQDFWYAQFDDDYVDPLPGKPDWMLNTRARAARNAARTVNHSGDR